MWYALTGARFSFVIALACLEDGVITTAFVTPHPYSARCVSALASVDQEDLYVNNDREADRLFALAGSLHLRRHRSPGARAAAIEAFRQSLNLRPDWVETDATFSVGSEVNNVFMALADDDDGKLCHGSRNDVLSTIDSCVASSVESVRIALSDIGYTAGKVLDRFGWGQRQRCPGPFFVRKNIDHTKASVVAELGPPQDPLDVAIRLFLLGLAMPRYQVEACLGPRAMRALTGPQFGVLARCHSDPEDRVVSLVQLFPLDANAQHETMLGLQGGEYQGMDGDIDKSINSSHLKRQSLQRPRSQDNSGAYFPDLLKPSAPSDLVFATDWPPPGCTALIEEPVMYIGPDSIGLVQHGPRAGWKWGDSNVVGDERFPTDILDLCCGSGIQGIVAATCRDTGSECMVTEVEGQRGSATRVTCIDINPRAVRFSRFNALLNGVGGQVTALTGDLYGALDQSATPEEDELPRPFLEVEPGTTDAIPNDTFVSKSHGGSGVGMDVSLQGGYDRQVSTHASLSEPLDSTPLVTVTPPVSFDLILANPPFVPVPPRLNSLLRRYDVFASGGASGEDVLCKVVEGAVGHLRPGGTLAVVTELANPAQMATKLREWLTMGSNTGEGDGEHATGGAFSCAVLYQDPPLTAEEYAKRRAGRRKRGNINEVQGWRRHLDGEGILHMAPGFMFVLRGPLLYGEEVSVGMKGSGDWAKNGPIWVESHPTEKVWAPLNTAAVEQTRRALQSVRQRLRDEER